MAIHSELIRIVVSKKILWVGRSAYPLHNIAHVSATDLTANRQRVIRRFIRSLVALGVIWGIALWGATAGGVPALGTLATIALLALAAYRLWELFDLLKRRFSVLEIHTTGGVSQTIVSKSAEEINELHSAITNAISNPAAEFQYNIQNFHVGDRITQVGDRNIGKLTR